MLKITYSDVEPFVEGVTQPVEAVVAQRSLVALRSGQPLWMQASHGSLPFPAQNAGVESLVKTARRLGLAITVCDADWLEITLPGTWIADSPTSDHGILLVTGLEESLERQLLTLKQCQPDPMVRV
ncbi:MAG: alr0857 family protein [Spirulina sp.]